MTSGIINKINEEFKALFTSYENLKQEFQTNISNLKSKLADNNKPNANQSFVSFVTRLQTKIDILLDLHQKYRDYNSKSELLINQSLTLNEKINKYMKNFQENDREGFLDKTLPQIQKSLDYLIQSKIIPKPSFDISETSNFSQVEDYFNLLAKQVNSIYNELNKVNNS